MTSPQAGLLAMVVVAACHRGPQLPDGDVAAALPATSTFAPDSLHGKASLVLFVSATCKYCLATIPRAIDAARAEDAHLALVFTSGGVDGARNIARATHFTGPTLVDDGALARRYHVSLVPYGLVLAGDGHATAALEGEQDERAIAAALAAAR